MDHATRDGVEPRPFFGWRVVAAAFVLAMFGWGLGFYGPPVYLHAVRETRGWSLGLVSAAVTVHYVVGALVVANLPRLHRAFGIARVTQAGGVLAAIGVYGWAAALEPWQLFAATMASGAGWVCMGAAAINAIVSPWFVRSRPAALSTAYNGASIGGVVFTPLWVAAIGAVGFERAALGIGLVTVVVVWGLAAYAFKVTPEALGQHPDGDVPGRPTPPAVGHAAVARPGGALYRDARFVTLAAAMALGLFAQVGLLAHLFTLLVPTLGTGAAGALMGAATAAAVAGRSLVGWLMPVGADRRLVAALSYGVQIAGSVLLVLASGLDAVLVVVGVLLIGAGIGNATSLPPLIAQVEFAKADVPRAVAMMVAVGQATYAFAPAAFGIVRETVPRAADAAPGAAPELFVAAIGVQVLAVIMVLAGRVRS